MVSVDCIDDAGRRIDKNHIETVLSKKRSAPPSTDLPGAEPKRASIRRHLWPPQLLDAGAKFLGERRAILGVGDTQSEGGIGRKKADQKQSAEDFLLVGFHSGSNESVPDETEL